MARTANKLTAKFVAGNGHKTPSRHSDGRGLYLNVSASGTKSWIFRWQAHGKKREMGLGSCDLVTLAEARDRALAAAKQVADGFDPIERRAGDSMLKLVEHYVQIKASNWASDETPKAWLRVFNRYGGPIKNLPANKVTTDLVALVVGPIWETKPSVAQLLLQIIRRVYDHARARNIVDQTSQNPGTYLGTMSELLPKRPKNKNLPSMPYTALPALMAQLRAKTDVRSAVALRFIILTGLRKNEALKTKWKEVDLDRAVLEIPGERMKARRDHVVPLSTEAVEILQAQHSLTGGNPEGYVFPARPHGGGAAGHLVSRVLDDQVPAPATVHGMRASLRTFLSNETDTPFEIAEDILSHAVGSHVTRSYRREQAVEKARTALQQWADYLAT
ncbi:MAG: tyrosine-type recombinase/integrase [Alphaproteobacteria bacterium]|nr:tyrosine-type recombinase/integrase [Alphaproteobacteria bacterium]